MFKLGKDEDIDLEEDFLQEVFTAKKQNYVKASCESSTLQSSRVPTSAAAPQRVLTNRTNIVTGNCQQNPSSADYTKVKDTTNKQNGKTATPEFENLLNDINWDLCFEDEDSNHELPSENESVNNLNEKKSVNDGHHLSGTLKSITHPQTSFPVINGSITTPPALGPKHSPWSSNRSARKRKFPGPAGLLPTQQNGSLSSHFSADHLLSPDTNDSPKLNELNDSLLLSQISENPFESQPWLQMQEDLDLNGRDSHLLKKYNIAWVLLKASNKQLPNGKVPILVVVLKSILEKGTEASVVFKDETGEMPGTIHRKVFEEYEDCLVPGAVLVVRKVSIFSPTTRKHYLNLTPTNVVCLYSPNLQRPKVLGPGVTHLRLQVREYALETPLTPKENTSERHFGSSHSPVISRNDSVGIGLFGTPKVKSHGPTRIQQTVSLSLENHEVAEPDVLISDDDLDKLFEDLNDDDF